MFPRRLDLETVLCPIANRTGNRAQRRALQLHIKRDLARLTIGRRGDFPRGDDDA